MLIVESLVDFPTGVIFSRNPSPRKPKTALYFGHLLIMTVAFGRPARSLLIRLQGTFSRCHVNAAPLAFTMFWLFTGLARAQWTLSRRQSIRLLGSCANRPTAPGPSGSVSPGTEPVFNGPSLGSSTGPLPGPAGPPPGLTAPPNGPAGPQYGPTTPTYGPTSPALPPYPPPSGPPPGTILPGQFGDARPSPPLPPIGQEVSPTADISPADGQSLLPTGSNSAYRLLDHLEVTGVVRADYENDQRIAWSGMEDNFVRRGHHRPATAAAMR